MRAPLAPTFVLLVALTLTGCSAAPGLAGQLARGAQLSPSPSAATATAAPTPPSAATPTAAPSATPSPAAVASPTTAASQATASPSDPATAAIQATIQRANDEQQEAFAKHDPTVMKDTATSDYYNQLVQINGDMASGGVSGIKLVKIEWGPITLRDATTAEATTFETWRTSYADGSTDQSRERNVYTLVQEQGAWKIQSDDHPDASSDQPAGSGAPAPSGSVPPRSPSGSVPPGSVPPPSSVAPGQEGVSHNWSGYAATQGTFTGVTGTWTVPESSGTGGFASGATWVGIGGVSSRDLIQAGTEETSNGSGTVHYDAWIEMLPQASHPVRFSVSPGDSVTVSIGEQATGQWLIAFKNHTTGQSYQTTVQYASSRSSAEWVEEAPSARRQVLPLDDFGTIQFSGGSAIKDGKSLTISQTGARPITMLDSRGNALARPSALAADGGGFSISRSTPSPTVQPRPGRRALPSLPGRLPGA